MDVTGGLQSAVYPDPNDKNVIVAYSQDCEQILEDIKKERDNPDRGEYGRKIATVPNVLLVQWLHEEWARGNYNVRPFTREFNLTVVLPKLRDPNYKYLLAK